MNLTELNNLSTTQLKEELTKCCGSSGWVDKMINNRPFKDKEQLMQQALKNWFSLNENDWLEAFDHHPKIGDVTSLKKKFENTAQWAAGEQSSVNLASEKIIQQLAQYNTDYEKKFGFIFIVCATGKSAEEMLELLKARIKNDRGTEIKIAAEEQNKITLLRLEKLLA